MDQTDIKILALLQKDATCSVAEIAEQVNLSRRAGGASRSSGRRRHRAQHDPWTRKALGLN